MKNQVFNWNKALLIPALVALNFTAGTCFGQVGIADLNISMMFVNQKDNSSVKVVGNTIELASEKIIYQENNAIDNIIISNGIIPDGESLGILYLINPNITF